MTEPARETVTALISAGVLDADLTALLWQLAAGGVPLVVGGTDDHAVAQLAGAFDDLLAAGRAGNGHAEHGLWRVRADSLEDVFEHFAGPPLGFEPDRLRTIGAVAIVRDIAGTGRRVVAAHYVRPLERDAGGHVQRRPPAVLAARDAGRDLLEHYAWALSGELADRLGLGVPDFERLLDRRRGVLEQLVAAGQLDADALRRAADAIRPSEPH